MSSIIPEWKSLHKNMHNPLHAICSYMAMFPASLPSVFINKYSKKGDTVLDPFSGRGTTVLQSCLMGRKGIGNDRNPLAYLLTMAKSNVPSEKRLLARISELEKKFNPKKLKISDEDENIKMIFSDYTLKQLKFLKEELKWRDKNVDCFIAAMITGVIHGGSSGYLSVSMPNTFSMSPNYIKNYIIMHDLKKPERNVFEILKKRLEKYYQKPEVRGKAYNLDVRNIHIIKDSSIDLIMTSPPYTKVIKYGQFNWIRLWFLGKNARDIDKKLFFSQSHQKYSDFMTDVLKEMKRVLKPNAKAILVIGDVTDKETGKPYNLAGYIWKKSAKPLGFKKIEEIKEDRIRDSDKVSKIWGEKRGNATKTDRILVLEKN